MAFIENEITPEILPDLLKGETLKEIVPVLGKRLLVKRKLENYFERNKIE